jgi:histidine triad (HIT) family protein
MSDCIFCKIATGAIPAEKIFENEQFFVIKDIRPKAPVHLLLIPHLHISSLLETETSHSDLLGNMLLGLNTLAKQYHLSGFRTIINSGESSGQEVFHLHFHLLANSGSLQQRLPGF